METKITLEFYPDKSEGIVIINDKTGLVLSKTIKEISFQNFILLAKHIVETKNNK